MAENDAQWGFRTTEENKKELQSWLDEQGLKPGQAIGAILELIRAAKARGAMPGRATEIDNFSSLIKQVLTAYTASLELAQNAESRIREDYAAKLEGQENTIIALQEKIKKAQDNIEEEKNKARTQMDKLTVLTTDQAAEIKELKEELAKTEELKAKVEELTQKLVDVNAEKEKAIFEEQKKCQEEIMKARDASQLAIGAAQKTVTEMQTKMQESYQKLYEEVHKNK